MMSEISSSMNFFDQLPVVDPVPANPRQDEIKKYVIFDDNYICGGYGQFDEEIAATVRSVMLNEGIGLNTTYTGKAFSGMEKYLKNSGIKRKNILFVNTGGTPLFFDDLKVI